MSARMNILVTLGALLCTGATAETECAGPECRVVSENGWGKLRPGTKMADVSKAGVELEKTGVYDRIFDKPEELRACNIYGVVGAPETLSAFTEDGVITSIGVWLDAERKGAIFKTDRGVALGDPEAAVRRAYPKLEERPDIYSDPPDKKLFHHGAGGNGIKFSINKGIVTGIDVGGDSINYVEGCL